MDGIFVGGREGSSCGVTFRLLSKTIKFKTAMLAPLTRKNSTLRFQRIFFKKS